MEGGGCAGEEKLNCGSVVGNVSVTRSSGKKGVAHHSNIPAKTRIKMGKMTKKTTRTVPFFRVNGRLCSKDTVTFHGEVLKF